MRQGNDRTIEWPTLVLAIACYAVWFAALWLLPLGPGIVVAGLTLALHSSLQHEVIHGHPFASQRLNDALVWPALGLVIPFARFRATHLAHHHDARLTDPYDDPETNYLDPMVWTRLPVVVQQLLRANNTLGGRLLLGPAIGYVAFLICEWRNRDRATLQGWLWHLPSTALVLWVVTLSPMPVWAYLIAVYIGLSALKLRTFLEHQAHVKASGRSVIVEDRGLFALLFLNNNLHVVHHMHPGVAWYRLPALYRANRAHYLRRNGGYRYASYLAVLRQYFWRVKDPVPHPLWHK